MQNIIDTAVWVLSMGATPDTFITAYSKLEDEPKRKLRMLCRKIAELGPDVKAQAHTNEELGILGR